MPPSVAQPGPLTGLALTGRVVDALRSVASRSELGDLMEAVTREMGFRHYALIHHDDLRTPRLDVVDLKDYPAAISERLIDQQRYRRDPVIRGCLFAGSAFLWTDLPRLIRYDRDACKWASNRNPRSAPKRDPIGAEEEPFFLMLSGCPGSP